MSTKKIDQVILTNFKKHESFSAKFEGKHFILLGVNGSGKSSILDAIKRALGQKGKLLEEPVKTGADGASISTYLINDKDKYCLEERFGKSGKSRLRFYRVNGNHKDELNPPMERLQAIFGNSIDFSPLIDMDGARQFEFFKEKLDVDISMYQHNREALFSDRTLVNRDIKTLEALLNSPDQRIVEDDKKVYIENKYAHELSTQKIDFNDLYGEKQRLLDQNRRHEEVLLKVEKLTTRIRDLKHELKNLELAYEDAVVWVTANPLLDVSMFDAQIERAKEHNEKIDQEIFKVSEHNAMVAKVRTYLATEKQLQEKKQKAEHLTSKLKTLDGELLESLTRLPLETIVPGLRLVYETTEDELTGKIRVKNSGLQLDGLPFNREQLSYGQLLKTVICLAAHFNAEKLNFIPIKEWNLLDSASKQEVLDLAKNNPDFGIQFGIEKVDDSQQVITELIEM